MIEIRVQFEQNSLNNFWLSCKASYLRHREQYRELNQIIIEPQKWRTYSNQDWTKINTTLTASSLVSNSNMYNIKLKNKQTSFTWWYSTTSYLSEKLFQYISECVGDCLWKLFQMVCLASHLDSFERLVKRGLGLITLEIYLMYLIRTFCTFYLTQEHFPSYRWFAVTCEQLLRGGFAMTDHNLYSSSTQTRSFNRFKRTHLICFVPIWTEFEPQFTLSRNQILS